MELISINSWFKTFCLYIHYPINDIMKLIELKTVKTIFEKQLSKIQLTPRRRHKITNPEELLGKTYCIKLGSHELDVASNLYLIRFETHLLLSFFFFFFWVNFRKKHNYEVEQV